MTSIEEEHYTVLFDVFALDRAASLLVTTSLVGSGVDGLDYAILSALKISGEMTTTQLAGRLGVPLTTMTDWVAQRVARGLLDRRPDPTDRRSRSLRLTPAGDRAYAQGREAFGRGYLAFVYRYEGDLDALGRTLRAMTEAIRRAFEDISADA